MKKLAMAVLLVSLLNACSYSIKFDPQDVQKLSSAPQKFNNLIAILASYSDNTVYESTAPGLQDIIETSNEEDRINFQNRLREIDLFTNVGNEGEFLGSTKKLKFDVKVDRVFNGHWGANSFRSVGIILTLGLLGPFMEAEVDIQETIKATATKWDSTTKTYSSSSSMNLTFNPFYEVRPVIRNNLHKHVHERNTSSIMNQIVADQEFFKNHH